jgi:cell division protein FtsW
MILAIVGEELGLVGLAFVVAMFTVLTLSAWRLGRRCVDPFGKYLVAGCLLLIGGQAVVNMGGVLAALPLTGVPLPFLSFARTNLLVVLAAVGAVMSVARFGPVTSSAEDRPQAQTRPASRRGRAPAGRAAATTDLELGNIAYIDSRRGHGRPRGARPGPR